MFFLRRSLGLVGVRVGGKGPNLDFSGLKLSRRFSTTGSGRAMVGHDEEIPVPWGVIGGKP
jgi:hypothetical protein